MKKYKVTIQQPGAVNRTIPVRAKNGCHAILLISKTLNANQPSRVIARPI